jgi:hypothetical protein
MVGKAFVGLVATVSHKISKHFIVNQSAGI